MKDSLRVEAYGTLDELNAVVGVVTVMNAEMVGGHIQVEKLEEDLQWIKNKLFDLGGILATVPDQEFKNMPQVTGNDVKKLEKMIDGCQKDLALLQEFILPGRGKVSAFSIRRERFVDGQSGCACTSRGKSRWAR